MTTTASPDRQTDDALPAGWKWARLGEVCEIAKGTSITKKKTIPGNIPVIAGGQKPPYYHSEYNREGETITVSASGAYAGFVSYHDYPIFASDCSTIKPYKNLLSTKFLFALLKSKQDQLYRLQIGSGQPHVYPRDLVNIPIPLPPLPEQERIARVLDECLASIARAKDAADAQLEAAVALPGAYLRQALPAEGDDFHMVPFKRVCTLEYGTSLRRKDRINGPYPVMGSNGVSGYHNKYLIQGPAIIVGRKGSAGEVNYVKNNCFPIDTTYYVKLVDSQQTDLVYLYYLLKSLDLPNLRGGSAIPGLNRNDVYSKHRLPLPPLDEQRRIASELDVQIAAAGALVSRIREQLEAIDALPGAYLSKAFAGEI